jgi:hypothetical protein
MAGRISLQFAGLALGLLIASSREIPAQHVPTPQIPPKALFEGRPVSVPFEYNKQHIYVTVTVNGKPGFVFMLDSGASRNILNLRVARQFGIPERKLKQEKNVGFGGDRIYVAPEAKIRAEIDSVPVARTVSVMDLGRFERHSNHPLDGMLGYPFLQHFVVSLDFRKDRLTFLPPTYAYRAPGVRVGILAQKRFVGIPITISSSQYMHHVINVVVDTGSNTTLLLYDRFVPSLGLEDSLEHSAPAKAYGLNGYYDVQLGTLHSIQVSTATAHDVPVDYIEPEEEVHLARNIQGEIGNGILQGFLAVTFDVPHRKMIFLPKLAPLQSGTVRTVTVGP